MKLRILFVASIIPVLTVASEQAKDLDPQLPQQQSGRDLLKACASSSMTSRGRARRHYCAGFISGVEEATRLLGRPDASICPPRQTSAREMARAYTDYASQPQVELNRPAAEVALQALMHNYPCEKPR